AVFEGKVKRIINIYGSYSVIVNHGEYYTVYSNLKSVNVAAGQSVGTKQNIGTVANESSTGIPQIKFEVWKGATPVNPKIWLTPE
ncbi:MAG: murein hydrolase activator EnvC family protein, partial [Mucilaginibacter sp.]